MTASGLSAGQLADIRARAEAATPGPWEVYDPNEGIFPPRPLWSIANAEYHNPTAAEDEPWHAVDVHVDTGSKADATFIAHARADVPALLAHVAELAGQIARVRERCESARRNRYNISPSVILAALVGPAAGGETP